MPEILTMRICRQLRGLPNPKPLAIEYSVWLAAAKAVVTGALLLSRETKINLLVLFVVVALSIPGGYRMFYKRLNKTHAMSMSMPTPARVQAAYMDPQPRHPSVHRMVPTRTLKWLNDLMAQQFARLELPADTRVAQFRGVASETFGFEPLAIVGPDLDEAWVYAMVWDARMLPTLEADSLAIAEGNAETVDPATAQTARIVAGQSVSVPWEIRVELRDFGYVTPPSTVTLVRARIAGSAVPGSRYVTFFMDTDGDPTTAADFASVPVRWWQIGEFAEE